MGRAQCMLVVVGALLAGCGAGPRTAVHRPPAERAPVRPAGGRRPAVGGELRRLLRLGRPVFCGGSRRRLVALTFDDGPGPYTHLALKELRRAGVRATFFVVGKSIRAFPALPRREATMGALGDHTDTHPFLPALAPTAMRREVSAGQAAAHRASGRPIRFFRPPYGGYTQRVTAAARQLGMVEILWSIDSGDALWGDFHVIAARVRRSVRPGSIVLFHENRGQTIRALRSILPYLHRRRLRAVSLPELLAADPPSPARLRSGLQGCDPGGRLTRFGTVGG